MAYAGENNDLVTCQFCERNFNPEALQRHAPICKKTQQKKRKVFDSSKQRADGTDIPTVNKRNQYTAKPQQPGNKQGINKGKPNAAYEAPAKKNNWRQKHEEFVRTIRAARGIQAALDRGEALPPPPPPTINPDYIQCDFCGRRFNESAAQRHINFCKEQHERLPKKKPDQMSAAQKMAIRTQYQPPKLKKAGQMNREADNYNSAPSYQRTPGSGSGSGVFAGRGGRGSGLSRNNMGYSDAPGSGHALRTGRTVETYSEARQLSAKQTATLPSKRYPTNDSYGSSQYTGTGYAGSRTGSVSKPSSRPMSGEDNWNHYGASYGYGSPGTVPRGRGSGGSRTSNGHGNTMTNAGNGSATSTTKFCYDCGAKFPVTTAKFCCECGARKA